MGRKVHDAVIRRTSRAADGPDLVCGMGNATRSDDFHQDHPPLKETQRELAERGKHRTAPFLPSSSDDDGRVASNWPISRGRHTHTHTWHARSTNGEREKTHREQNALLINTLLHLLMRAHQPLLGPWPGSTHTDTIHPASFPLPLMVSLYWWSTSPFPPVKRSLRRAIHSLFQSHPMESLITTPPLHPFISRYFPFLFIMPILSLYLIPT